MCFRSPQITMSLSEKAIQEQWHQAISVLRSEPMPPNDSSSFVGMPPCALYVASPSPQPRGDAYRQALVRLALDVLRADHRSKRRARRR